MANGYAERHGGTADARQLATHGAGPRPRTVGADKGYDTRAFVAGVRALAITPDVAQNVHAARRQRDRRADGPAPKAMRKANTPRPRIEPVFAVA